MGQTAQNATDGRNWITIHLYTRLNSALMEENAIECLNALTFTMRAKRGQKNIFYFFVFTQNRIIEPKIQLGLFKYSSKNVFAVLKACSQKKIGRVLNA